MCVCMSVYILLLLLSLLLSIDSATIFQEKALLLEDEILNLQKIPHPAKNKTPQM